MSKCPYKFRIVEHRENYFRVEVKTGTFSAWDNAGHVLGGPDFFPWYGSERQCDCAVRDFLETGWNRRQRQEARERPFPRVLRTY